MVLQPDGKILLAGSSGSDFAVARLLPGGSPDTSFGTGGRTTVDFGSSDDGSAMALQPDGKIVVAGTTGAFPNEDTAVTRLQPNGLLDSSFGKAGKSVVDLGHNELANGVALQSDGKIVVDRDEPDSGVPATTTSTRCGSSATPPPVAGALAGLVAAAPRPRPARGRRPRSSARAAATRLRARGAPT